MDDPLLSARLDVWRYTGVSGEELVARVAPSVDVLTLAFSRLARAFEESRAAFEDLKTRFDELEARERLEHRPVSGVIRFIGGRPVKGRVSFPVSPTH